MSYSVKFLDDKEFESLPYPDMETSLGVADPEKKQAFVRKTGIKALDYWNLAHEVEHLEEGHEGKHADHFKNGVYYKSFGDTLQAVSPVLSFIPGVGPLLSAGAGIGGGLMGKGNNKQDNGFQGMNQFQMPQMGSYNQYGMPSQGSNSPNISYPQQSAGGDYSGGYQTSPEGLSSVTKQLYGNYLGRR